MKTGLKLWSTNKNYIDEALALYKKYFFDFIELFYVPGSMNLLTLWKNIEIPFVIHAPHTVKGLNPAEHKNYENNLKLAKESFKYADELNADFVIFHPGMGGTAEETIRQVKDYGNRSRILIENKPYHSISDPRLLCRGATPEEIKYIVDTAGVGFCFDIGHAICAANSLKRDKDIFINELISLNPQMYHLSDGDYNSVIDAHPNFGNGNYPLKSILDKIPNNSMVTIETDKNYNDSLHDFENDVIYLRTIRGIK